MDTTILLWDASHTRSLRIERVCDQRIDNTDLCLRTAVEEMRYLGLPLIASQKLSQLLGVPRTSLKEMLNRVQRAFSDPEKIVLEIDSGLEGEYWFNLLISKEGLEKPGSFGPNFLIVDREKFEAKEVEEILKKLNIQLSLNIQVALNSTFYEAIYSSCDSYLSLGDHFTDAEAALKAAQAKYPEIKYESQDFACSYELI